MRFKNLTITLTLTCLSVVALAGLTLLPITEGICEWSDDNDGHSKSYTNSSVDIEQEAQPDYDQQSRDTQMGRGWFLNASLAAGPYGAYANVDPSIYGMSSFVEAEVAAGTSGIYGGTANVLAWRKKVSVSVCSSCGQSHTYEGDKKSNKNQERTLTAKLKADKWYDVTGIAVEQEEQTGHEAGASLTATAEVSGVVYSGGLSATGHYIWTHTDGKKYKENKKLTRVFYKVEEVSPTGQSRSVGATFAYVPADTEACLDFNFEGHSSSNSVSYSSGTSSN
ncbi:MAG: hypothetical protein OXU23_17400 [Candidatus Poribacteria bacterium]|nr:hypothetical protein [Candidatus Poribacteria bacterium]